MRLPHNHNALSQSIAIRITIRVLAIVTLLLLPYSLCAKSAINIKTQQQFDSIQHFILEELNNGENSILIRLASQRFKFNENHICLHNLHYPKASITISGSEGSMVYSEGMGYTQNDRYTWNFNHQNTFLDENLDEVSTWSDSFVAHDTIRVLDEKAKMCFLPYEGLMPQDASRCLNTFILMTMWYYSSIYKVDRITEKGVFFTCDNLYQDSWLKCWNVNLDYAYTQRCSEKRQLPRFRLCNTLTSSPLSIANGIIDSKERKLHECRNTTFLNIKECTFKEINIQGISFIGNTYNWNKYLLQFSACHLSKCINITHNIFKNLKTLAIHLEGTNNATVKSNNAENCALGILKSCNNCHNTKVINNHIDRCGTRLSNIPMIQTIGTNFLVKGNILSDFGYSALNSGVHYTESMNYPCQGVIENNELFYTNITLEDIEKRTLMDSGAIYVATQNTKTIIRNNYIHDYIGICDYRGIFCDDGANNCIVENNIIQNTPTSYSIQFSEYDLSSNPRNKSPYFCRGNIAKNNHCDGAIRNKVITTND